MTGEEMYGLVRRLYPVCRSITGDGVRETLKVLRQIVPLEIHEVPTGTKVFDWTIPEEWNIRDAWIATRDGRRVIDFGASNLHVVSYSEPVTGRFRLAELRPHLHIVQDHPDWVPYRTAYYERTWGFCLSRREYETLTDTDYDVCIDSSLAPGSLTYAELRIPGSVPDEFLISTHICHPSLANDNLSGIAVSAFLARELQRGQHHYSYRFLYVPGTIGSLTWLSRNRDHLDGIRGGMTLVCLGDERPLLYKRSLAGTSAMDCAASHVLRHRRPPGAVVDYYPFGYDERQFNSPGFRIPVGSLMRGRHGQFAEYHTSADNLELVSPSQLEDSLAACVEILSALEQDRVYQNLTPCGEPQLGRRHIFRSMGGPSELASVEAAMLWVLALSDGTCSLLSVAERADLPLEVILRAVALLKEHQLLDEA